MAVANTVNVLSHLSEEPRPLEEIPDGHGIAGNGKSLTERHLIATVTKEGKQLNSSSSPIAARS